MDEATTHIDNNRISGFHTPHPLTLPTLHRTIPDVAIGAPGPIEASFDDSVDHGGSDIEQQTVSSAHRRRQKTTLWRTTRGRWCMGWLLCGTVLIIGLMSTIIALQVIYLTSGREAFKNSSLDTLLSTRRRTSRGSRNMLDTSLCM